MKIAVVGAGHMGRIHLQKIPLLDGVELCGIVDAEKTTAQSAADTYKTKFYTDCDDILDQADGVVISTPTGSHHAIAKKFLLNNTHVFIEKPIAAEIEQARELIDIAAKKDLIIQVGHLERFNPAFKKALQFINKPLFIETRRLSPFPGRATDVDVVLDLMIHDIDLALSIVPGEPDDICAFGNPLITDKLDFAAACYVAPGNCNVQMTVSRISSFRERSLSVLQKDKYIHVDFVNGRLAITRRGIDGGPANEEYHSEKVDPVFEEISEFATSIKTKTKPRIQGHDGLNALVLAEKIKKYIAEHSHSKKI